MIVLFLIYNSNYEIIGLSTDEKENSISLPKDFDIISRGSIYDPENEEIITPKGERISISDEDENNVLSLDSKICLEEI